MMRCQLNHSYEYNCISCERLSSHIFLLENFVDHCCILHDCVIDSSDDSSITTATSSCTCSQVKLFSLSKNLRMYHVKLKTGLSPSVDDHSISEPQKKRGTYTFKLLKNTEPVERKLHCLYWVRGL